MKSDDTAFGQELEVFRKEEQSAQQFFFAYLAIRSEAASDKQILKLLNTAPLFWLTTENALLLAAFVALGRVFDQGTRHNLDRLLKIAADDLSLFSRLSLAHRRQAEGMTAEAAAEYASDKYEPTAQDFRHLRKKVAEQRKVYRSCYQEIRNKIFAHKELSNPDETRALFNKTNIGDMKVMFGLLHSLHDALWELLLNGRKPELQNVTFVVPPAPKIPGRQLKPGEVIAYELNQFLSAGAASILRDARLR